MRIFKNPLILFRLFPRIYWRDSAATDQVYITFDDGPDPKFTPKILNILEQENVQATFFVLVNKAERNEKLIKQIHQKGHEIGIHSYNHERLFLQSTNHIYDQLNQSKQIIEQIIEQPVCYFRPPYGTFSPRLIKVCTKLNLQIVMWSFMTYDFDVKVSSQSILNLISDSVKSGDILVLHDGHTNSHRTTEILQYIIVTLKEKGLKLIAITK